MHIIDCLKSFVAVAEEKSILNAAKNLSVSSSKLSLQINRLEEYYNARLFIRSTKKLQLTESGYSLYLKTKKILAEINTLENTIAQANSDVSGTLKISITGHGLVSFIIKVISKFLKKYPLVKVELVNTPGLYTVDLESSELALTFAQLHHPDITCKPVAIINRGIFGAPTYFNKYGTPQNVEDLLNHNCLIYTHKFVQNRWILDNKELFVKGSFQSNSVVFLKQATLEGLGIAWFPLTTVIDELKDGLLRQVLTPFPSPTLTIFAYCQKQLSSNLINIFIQFLQEYIAHDKRFSQFSALIDLA